MSRVRKSLTYDALFVLLAGLIAVMANGAVQGWALVLLVGALLKVPYDTWDARRADRRAQDAL